MAAEPLIHDIERGTSAENPFLGLSPYAEADRWRFFGRDREASQLFRLVERSGLTVLFGRSGLGKSSLLNAGLFPRLREESYLPIRIRLLFGKDDLPPMQQVRARIREAADSHCADYDAPDPAETLWEYLHRAQFWSKDRNRSLDPVLVFDQFEEIFSLTAPDVLEELRKFIDAIADVAENRIPDDVRQRLKTTGKTLPFDYKNTRAKVIFSLREDFLPQLEDLTHQMPSISESRFHLKPMSRSQATEVILELWKSRIDRKLADAITDYVAAADGHQGNDEIEPALLSLFCHELERKRVEWGLSSVTGGLLDEAKRSTLADFFEREVSACGRRMRRLISTRLLTRDGRRSSCDRTEAIEKLDVAEKDIERLIDRRVLRQEPHLGSNHIELIHDVLTRVAADSRRRRRRGQRIVRGGAFATIVTVAFLVVLENWLVTEGHLTTTRVEKRELRAVFNSERFLADDISFSRRLATQAVAIRPTSDARRAWINAYKEELMLSGTTIEVPEVAWLVGQEIVSSSFDQKRPPSAQYFGPDVNWDRVWVNPRGGIVSADITPADENFSEDTPVNEDVHAVTDIRSWKLGAEGVWKRVGIDLQIPSFVSALTPSNDGTFLAAAIDGGVQFYKIENGMPGKMIAFNGFVAKLAISADDKWLAAVDHRGRALVANLEKEGETTETLQLGPIDPSGDLAISRDGRYLAFLDASSKVVIRSRGAEELLKLDQVDVVAKALTFSDSGGALWVIDAESGIWRIPFTKAAILKMVCEDAPGTINLNRQEWNAFVDTTKDSCLPMCKSKPNRC